jgi:hypothetical protein
MTGRFFQKGDEVSEKIMVFQKRSKGSKPNGKGEFSPPRHKDTKKSKIEGLVLHRFSTIGLVKFLVPWGLSGEITL